MNIVIVGAGKVGETLVANFIREKHDLVIVDSDYETIDDVVNRYDVKGIVGGGLERNVLIDAGVDKADLLIACTSRDEVNILCCVLAKKIGVSRTIARVRDPEYFKEMENMRADLGLDFAFNPELTTAVEIAQILKFPSATSVENFAGGRARMAEFVITAGNPLIGKTLKQIAKEYGNKILIGVVRRGDKEIIPHGDFVLENEDRIYIIASEHEIVSFCKKLKIFKPRAKSAFIIGGGKIGYYLAQELISSGVSVKIVEANEERATELSTLLPAATIIVGNGTEQELLDEENLKGNDACITLTGMDEENVMISLYAKQSKVDKIITKIDRPSILKMVKMLGLDTVVTPRNVIANHIVRFVRAYSSATGEGIDTLYKIGNKAEAMEFTVGEGFKGVDTPLKELGIKKNLLIGGIVRGNEFILPSGDSQIKVYDRIIVVSEEKQITKLSQILRKS
ncbi:MAG: Trk system potassium transporter TrkA [Clostridiales bacterium]|nr:Trk system potassium transporter TrkA [Clostridiales bacterium]